MQHSTTLTKKKCGSEQLPVSRMAAVLPRYGESLGGGAETLVRALLEKLAETGMVSDIEVWTTCALDHRTWANELPPGETLEGGVTVHRFPVDERNLDVFIQHELAIHEGRPMLLDEQLDWLSESVNSRGLYQHIVEHGKEFDALLFAPYLFATTFWGSLIYPERSIVFPCLHNEPYAYLDVFRHLFQSVRGLIFNAEGERNLSEELYAFPDLAERSAVVGMGFDKQEQKIEGGDWGLDSGSFRQKPFLLYSGRKEQGKNLDLLLDYFAEFSGRNPQSELELVIIGAGDIHFQEVLPKGVVDLGFVTEAEKSYLMEQAVALCQPSVNESFSIVMMEAWLLGTPSIVHGDCAVTRGHVVESGGGLFFQSVDEFCAVVSQLQRDGELQKMLGQAGLSYVETEYSWDAVLERLYKAFLQFGIGEREERQLAHGE